MATESNLDDLVDACVLAAERIDAHGSPRLRVAMRLVLFILGQDIARRQMEET